MHAHKLLNKIAIVITFVIWVMEALDYSQCKKKLQITQKQDNMWWNIVMMH